MCVERDVAIKPYVAVNPMKLFACNSHEYHEGKFLVTFLAQSIRQTLLTVLVEQNELNFVSSFYIYY